MDSFEWLNGYRVGFGLHHVDFEQPFRPRTPKRSAHYYYQIIKENGFPLPDEEKLIYGHFREGFAWSTATASYQVTEASCLVVLCLVVHICMIGILARENIVSFLGRLKVAGGQMGRV